MYTRTALRLLALILLLIGSTVAVVLSLGEGLYILTVFGSIALVGTTLRMIRYYNRHARKLMFMFNSIENGDYSFKFTRRNNTLVNVSLNRIRDLLAKARDETIEQEKYFQLILESVTTGIVIIDAQGHVIQTNREARQLLGIDPFTHIVQLSRLDERFPAVMREISAVESRQLICNNEQGSITLSVQASTIVRRGERLKILALTDIENELSDREIESWIRLSRVLTHEIKNTINTIT